MSFEFFYLITINRGLMSDENHVYTSLICTSHNFLLVGMWMNFNHIKDAEFKFLHFALHFQIKASSKRCSFVAWKKSNRNYVFVDISFYINFTVKWEITNNLSGIKFSIKIRNAFLYNAYPREELYFTFTSPIIDISLSRPYTWPKH